MAAFYDLLERKWMESVAAGYAEIIMNVGLTAKHDATAAARRIYAPTVIRELESLLAAARAAADGDLPTRLAATGMAGAAEAGV